VPWRDIRPELGATSTIIVEYLRALSVPLDTPLATALFYALRAETRDLGREATHAERVAYLFLFPLVDFHLLSRISQPKVPREHFAALDARFGQRKSGAIWSPSTWAASPTPIWWPRWRTCCSRGKGRTSFSVAAATVIAFFCRCAPSPVSVEPAP